MSNGDIVTRTNFVCDWCPEDRSALFEWNGEALCQPCFEEAEEEAECECGDCLFSETDDDFERGSLPVLED